MRWEGGKRLVCCKHEDEHELVVILAPMRGLEVRRTELARE